MRLSHPDGDCGQPSIYLTVRSWTVRSPCPLTPLFPLCCSSASSGHPVHSSVFCFVSTSWLPFSLPLSSFQSLSPGPAPLLPCYPSATHSTKPKPGSCPQSPPMPWLVNAKGGFSAIGGQWHLGPVMPGAHSPFSFPLGLVYILLFLHVKLFFTSAENMYAENSKNSIRKATKPVSQFPLVAGCKVSIRKRNFLYRSNKNLEIKNTLYNNIKTWSIDSLILHGVILTETHARDKLFRKHILALHSSVRTEMRIRDVI